MPPPDLVRIEKTEEKGSDVNLGAHLVRDALLDKFDTAYVLTDDTDLCEPVRIVTKEAKKHVCIIAPNRSREHQHPIPAPSLAKLASSIHYIDDAELARSQFPNEIIRVGKKPVIKPKSWVKANI